MLSSNTYLITGGSDFGGKNKGTYNQRCNILFSGKVRVVALWTLRTSTADSVPQLLPPSPPIPPRCGSEIYKTYPRCSSRTNTAANQGEKSQARGEPEPSQAEHSKAVVPCVMDDPARWGFIHHCLSLSGAWGQESLPTGAPVILCLSQQPCRTKSKW